MDFERTMKIQKWLNGLKFSDVINCPSIIHEMGGMTLTPGGMMYWSRELIENHVINEAQNGQVKK